MEQQQPAPDAISFPSVEDLDRLPPAACQAELARLFEGAPRFTTRLAAARPFGSDEAIIARAYEVARDLPEDEAVELVNAHPRLGSDPGAMSTTSRAEQGYASAAGAPAQDVGDDEADAPNGGEPAWVDEELGGLNEVYERAFGFRYVVFVAGRPREALIPLLEISLRNDRDAELRRAVGDCIAIAEDRLRRARGLGTSADERL